MAILNGLIRKMTGSVGDFTFKKQAGRTIVSEKNVNVTNPHTTSQYRTRMRWANIVRMYKGISPLINYGFENKAQGVNDYNMFMKLNTQQTAVFLTKPEVDGGGCVAAPYQLTQGSLKTIVTTGTGANVKTDINVGNMKFNDSTTIGELAQAIVMNNSAFNFGDQLSFFLIIQSIDSASGIPVAAFYACNIILTKNSSVPLSSAIIPEGFGIKDNCIAYNGIEGNSVYCWVHSRKSNGKVLVSTQRLIDNNQLLGSYTSQEAFTSAVNSYGGSKEVFLDPSSHGELGDTNEDETITTNPEVKPSTGDDDDEGMM